jgi:DNA-binding transcriptional LysR family regulator
LLINLIGLSSQTLNSKEIKMVLTETKTVDQITVTENGIVLYREATRILKDGEQIAQTYHRTSLTPAQDLTGQPAQVVAICNAAWTDEVVAAYQAQVAAQQTQQG